jgi:hypothetical protein
MLRIKRQETNNSFQQTQETACHYTGCATTQDVTISLLMVNRLLKEGVWNTTV